MSDQSNNKHCQKRGFNVIECDVHRSALSRFISQLNDPLIYILFAAAAVSLLLGEINDAVIIISVVALNAAIGVIQEGRAEHALSALSALSAPHAFIVSGENIKEVPASDLVCGDIVLLCPGCSVPADITITEASNLQIEESALTGEAIPARKDTIHENMAYMSTNIVSGNGRGIVCAIGMDTKIGQIARLIRSQDQKMTPLQARLAVLGRMLGIISVTLCALLFAIAIIQKANVWEMLLSAISLAVAAVPEGMPAIVTMVLALSVSKMARANTIVRHLPSVETLGCVDLVCTDKTGTLTANRMSVTGTYTLSGDASDFKELCRCMALCNDASVSEQSRMGDPTELALLDEAVKNGISLDALRLLYKRTGEIPFDSSTKMMTTHHIYGGEKISYTKGSPDDVIAKCKYVISDKVRRPVTAQDKRKISKQLEMMAEQGLRVLAFASSPYDSQKRNSRGQNLTFLGLAALLDPPRSEAKRSVQRFSRAGIKTVMITGDRIDTAFAIARQLGIAARMSECMPGEELDSLTDEELVKRLDTTSVYAHVSPEHKMRIVNAAKSHGSIVAMTGDGVNDAPSLKAADVGIAMGRAGCDVAKNAADIILADDNFATIADAIALGRCIYENIRKSILFLLSSNLGEILTMFTSVILGFSSPLKSSHILWINLITDSLPAIALGVDTCDADSHMDQKPRPRNESILSQGGASYTLFYGVIIAAASLVAFLHPPVETLMHMGSRISIQTLRSTLMVPDILNRSQTYAFMVLGLTQLFHAIGMRDVTKSIFKMDHLENKLMILALSVGIALQAAVINIPYLARAFGASYLTATEWVHIFLLSLLPVIAHEILVVLHREPF